MLQPTVQVATAISTIAATQPTDCVEIDPDALVTTVMTAPSATQLDDFVITELQAARDSLGDVIVADVTKWLDAFAEFRRSKGSVYAEFKLHWKRMESEWVKRV